MKNTVLISEIFPPLHGGSGRWFWELYSRLPKEYFYIAAGYNENVADFDKSHTLSLKRFPLSSWSWGIKSLTGLKYYWKAFWCLKQYIKENEIKVIHCGRCLPEGFIGYLLSKTLNLPMICFVHGEDVEAASTSRELTWIANKVLNHATTIISNSTNSASILEKQWNISPDKIQVLNPGVDASKFIPSSESEQLKGLLNCSNRTNILTVGRLQKRKGQDLMIQAIPAIKRVFPDVLYTIVGNGDDENYLKQLVFELDLNNNVRFLTDATDELMLQYYQCCDIFILPNRTVGRDIEGFGMVLVEAQSCGKVVIAGDSGGTRETMLIDETGFIIDCTDHKNIAEKLIDIIPQKDTLKTMGKRGREHVLNTLDWGVHVKAANKVFSKL